MPTMRGEFAVFDEWTEIDSLWEGHFMESLSRGSFAGTIRENRSAIKVLYDHGHDPSIGNKPLGPIEELREIERGVHYEVPLLDASYTRDLLPGLDAGLYGASFRFEVIRDEWNDEPPVSEHNPKGIPERVINEVRLFEFGPVTFPAYVGASAEVG
jgi:HK97 family phage prohead protease